MYIPLHVHTEYSILDGMSTVVELCERAQELGLPGVAITDHGTMMGVKPFHDYFKRNAPDIKPILGNEIYLTDNYDFRIKDQEHRRTFHLILLAKNLAGYRNLCKMTSIGATDGLYNKPRIDLSVLKEHREGLICLSGCIGGEIPQCILDDDIEGAEYAVKRYRDIFGDDFYLEVSIHPNSREGNPQDVVRYQRKVAECLYQLGEKFGITVVATNDSHFTYKEQAEAHDVMLAVNCGKLVRDPSRLHYTGEEYLKSEAEMLEVFPDHPEVVWNTRYIYDKIEFYDIDVPVQVPLPKTFPPEIECDALLKEHAIEGFNNLFGDKFTEGKERLLRELDVIREHSFARNILMIEDIVRFARSEGIEYGPGRGSAAGSLVCYCLGITKVNPIKYGLIFERFINPEKQTPFPGIDIDFEAGSLSCLWKHLFEVYGTDCVAGQVSFQEPSLGHTFEKVARAMEISRKKSAPIVQILRQYGSKNRDILSDIRAMLDRDERTGKAFRIANLLQGRKRGTGVHACAVYVSPRPISDIAPVMTGKSYFGEDIPIVQYEKRFAEEAGLLRLNLLELRTLNIIKDTLNEINTNNTDNTDKVDITGIDEDPDTDMMMYLGDKTGVFMFESDTMKQYLRSLGHCPRFRELVALNTLYRPLLIDLIPEYQSGNQTKADKTRIAELDNILSETRGILIYQEQYISFFEAFLKIKTGEAVLVFKAMSKRKINEMELYRKEFIVEGIRKHYDENLLEKTWSYLVENSCRAFIKSHTVCYTVISYQCAYLKAHYPKTFLKFYRKYNSLIE